MRRALLTVACAGLALAGALSCGPEVSDGEVTGPEPCSFADIETSAELRVDDAPCDPCRADDDPTLWVTLETSCEQGIEWQTSCVIIVDHVVVYNASAQTDAVFTGYCSETIPDWRVAPNAPIDHAWARLSEIFEALEHPFEPPGPLSLEVYFQQRELHPALVTVDIE